MIQLLVGLALLVGAGWPAARRLEQTSVFTVCAAIVISATAIGCAGALTAVTNGPLVIFAIILVIVFDVAGLVLLPDARQSPPRLISTVLTLPSAALLLLTRRNEVFYDARVTWLYHAMWFEQSLTRISALVGFQEGGITNEYPPLSAATIAFIWRITDHVDLKTVQVVPAMVSASICALAALALFRRLAGCERTLRAGWATAFALALCATGPRWATNGFQDHLWSVAAVLAALSLLAATPGRQDLAYGWLALVLCSLTKNEGEAAAAMIVVLYALRPRATGRWFVVSALTPMTLWVIFVGRSGSPRTVKPSNVFDLLDVRSTRWGRVPEATSAVASQLLPGVGILTLAILVCWAMGRLAPAVRVRGAVPIAIVGIGHALTTLLVYVLGDTPLVTYLDVSVDRALLGPRMLCITSAFLLVAPLLRDGPSSLGRVGQRFGQRGMYE